MHKLYELKDQLCKELESYADRQTLDLQTLDVIDKLAHSAKNICKVIEFCEGEKSDGNRNMPMYSGMMYSGAPMNYGYSGRNIHRNSLGQYSRADSGFSMQLQNLIDTAPNEQVRQKLMSAMNEA